MAWRMAKSLDTLLKQLNTGFPKRSKVSDGGIGDAKHASRNSDHNPHIKDGKMSVVTARDFTHDPQTGIDCNWLADSLIANKDPRIKYIIWNKKIMSGNGGPSPWKWRSYNGVNAHKHHLHLSVKGEKALYDNTNQWKLDFPTNKVEEKPVKLVDPPKEEVIEEIPTLPESSEQGSAQMETTKVEVGDISVETTSAPAQPKEKIAVVAPAPTKWYSGLGTKITTAITGNAIFIWISDRIQSLIGVVQNPVFWYVIIGLVAAVTLIWLWHEAKENSKKKDRDTELIKLSLEQNSTPNNFVQTIPHDEVELYRLRGYKIVPIGESVPHPAGLTQPEG